MAAIRDATPRDADAVAAIYAHHVAHGVMTFDETAPTPQAWRERVTGAMASGHPFLVAETDGAVVGYAYVGVYRARPAYRFTVEDSIYLAPGHEGHGLGRRLLSELLARCETAGFRRVVAVISCTEDDASRALHATLGFTHVGVLERVGFKHGRWVDTLLLQRGLGADAGPTTP